jgi:hypothetical protein
MYVNCHCRWASSREVEFLFYTPARSLTRVMRGTRTGSRLRSGERRVHVRHYRYRDYVDLFGETVATVDEAGERQQDLARRVEAGDLPWE